MNVCTIEKARNHAGLFIFNTFSKRLIYIEKFNVVLIFNKLFAIKSGARLCGFITRDFARSYSSAILSNYLRYKILIYIKPDKD